MIELSTGQMAELNCITKKTLRIYNDMGLLEPSRIDETNGYHFYTLNQCSTVDMILQLQSMGISLSEIKDLLDRHCMEALTTLLESHEEALSEEIKRLRMARYTARKMHENCDMLTSHRPLSDTIILERLPERWILTFPIVNEGARMLSDDVAAFLEQWELNLRKTKRLALDQGLPMELYRNVGCMISHENLVQHRFEFSGSFIIIDGVRLAEQLGATKVPAGEYLTLYKSSYSLDGHNTEVQGLNQLLDYIEASNLKLVGDYLGEIIADTPAFLYEGREMLYKLQIPISHT